MNELIIGDERAEDGIDEAPGATMVLTEQGWESSEYVQPEIDWSILDDGSYCSPDGRTRTWPQAGPQ